MKSQYFRASSILFAIAFTVIGILLLTWPELFKKYDLSPRGRSIGGVVLLLYGVFRGVMVWQGFYKFKRNADEDPKNPSA